MHTVGHRVMEEDWKFLGWFEHSKTILYFAGGTQPLCLSHVTLAMTPLPLSALLPPNFCFSFPGILSFFSPGLQPPCQELVRQSGSDYPLCLVLNIPRTIRSFPQLHRPPPSWVLWRAFLVFHQELQYRGSWCTCWAKLPLGHVSDSGGAGGWEEQSGLSLVNLSPLPVLGNDAWQTAQRPITGSQ